MPPKSKHITVRDLLAAQGQAPAEERGTQPAKGEGRSAPRRKRRTKAEIEAAKKAEEMSPSTASSEEKADVPPNMLSLSAASEDAAAPAGEDRAAGGNTKFSIVPEGVTVENVLEITGGEAEAEEPAAPLHSPLAPTDLRVESYKDPLDVVAQHIISNTRVGREVPNFANRAFILPLCYVPRGSDTLEEVAQRDDASAKADPSSSSSAAAAASSSSSARRPTTAFAVEEGVHFDTSNAFMCPFMLHQRLAIKGFVDATVLQKGQQQQGEEGMAKEEAVVVRIPDEIKAAEGAEGAFEGAEEEASTVVRSITDFTAEDLPSHELTPSIVLRRAAERAVRIAKQKGLSVITAVQPSATTFAVEQTLMRHRARPPLEEPQGVANAEEFLWVDVDVRLGVAAVFPKAIASTDATSLTPNQKAYVSRFQLLEEGGALAAAQRRREQQRKQLEALGLANREPTEEEKAIAEAEEAALAGKGDVHVATDVVVGAFDPYFPMNTFQSIQATLKKLSAVTKLDRAAEAVQLRSKIPIFQLTFQSRVGDKVMVLETHDHGASWVEIKSQEGLGAVGSPIVNSKRMAIEAHMIAKHVRKCNQLESEWASYYLQHTFLTNAKKASAAGATDSGAGQSRAAQDLSEVGYVHPVAAQAVGKRLETLRQTWQLVSIERTAVQAAQCTESMKLVSGGLAAGVEAQETESDLKAISPEFAEKAVTSQSPASALILWLLQHTKTLYADDGVSFLRGATTFRRRVSISNEHLMRERGSLWKSALSSSAAPLSPPLLGLDTSRFGAALQTLFNECSSIVCQRFADLTHAPEKGYKSLVGDVPLYVFAGGNAGGLPQPIMKPSSETLGEMLEGKKEVAAEKVEETEQVTPIEASNSEEGAKDGELAPPKNVESLAEDAGEKKSATILSASPTATAISVAHHGLYLQQFAHVPLPISDLAKSFAFHAYIPWETVHYPLSLNTFTDVRLSVNIGEKAADATPAVDAAAPAAGTSADESVAITAANNVLPSSATISTLGQDDVPTFAIRKEGKMGVLKGLSKRIITKTETTEDGELNVSKEEVGRTEDVRFDAEDPLAFDKSAMTAEVESVVKDGMKALFSSSFTPTTRDDSRFSDAAPVFSVSFGHGDWGAFDCQSVLSDVLIRMLGKSVKTTVSALCFSDHPSAAVRSLRPEAAAVVNDNYTPLGTRSVTSVFLDSKDSSRSQVTNIGKLFKSPESQEHGVRTLLRRMLAPSSLQQARVLVQCAVDKSEDSASSKESVSSRELISEGAEEPPTAQQPYLYKVSVLPEEALDVFRPVVHSTLDKSDASDMTKLSARLSAMESLFSKAAASQSSSQESLKEMIRTSVSVSQVILENSKPSSIAQLLESKVKGDSTFAYLPQLLEQENLRNGAELTTRLAPSRSTTELSRLLHRDLSRVVFAEDKYFVSEGVQGSRNRTDPIPTTYVIHRTLHDVSVGSDGIARYEKVNFVFFTLRDPNIITGARGKPERVQEMLEAAARADASSSKTEVNVPNSATSRDVPLISDVFSLLHNFGRWGVDKLFAAKTTRDAVQLEGRTASGESVHHVLQGWLQSALSQQSADVLAMVQGDEQLARNPLVHILIDAANKCSNVIQQQCRTELLHWISGLSEVAAIMTPRELENAYLTMDVRKVFRKSGIPLELIPHIFHPKTIGGGGEDGQSDVRDPFLRVLPCDTYCKITPRLLVDFGTDAVVPVMIPKTLHTSDGMPVPEGSVAFVGHATSDLISKCNNYFGEMAPIHQLGDLLVIPATQDIDASLAVELSTPGDPQWQSSLEVQYARMKTIQGHAVLMKRYRHNQFVPPTVLERSFVHSGDKYAIPQLGAPLYKKGKLVTFNKGSGAHEFVSRVLQSANLRKVVSFITK